MGERTQPPLEKLLTSGLIVFVGMVVQLGLGFVSRIVIARLLGRYDYGTVALGLTMLMSISTIVLLGTKSGIARYMPRFDDESHQRGTLVSAFQIVVPIAIFSGSIVIIGSDFIAANIFHDRSVGPSLKAFGAAVPFAVLMKLTIGVSRGKQQSIPRVLIQNLALPLSQFGLIAVVLLQGYRASGVSWAYFGAYLVVSIPCTYYLYNHTLLVKSVEYVRMHKDLVLFSLPLMTVSIMELVFEQLDTFIIGFYSGVESVGVYNSVYPLAVFLTTVLISFRFLTMPILSELHSKGEEEEMKNIFQTITKWIFITTVPLLFAIAFFPQQTIWITFGPEYVSGATALSILTFGFFTQSVSGLNGATLTSIGNTRIIMLDNIVVAGVNLVLNFLLIPQYGLNGAAIATAVAYTMLNILYGVQLHKYTGIHPFTRGFLQISIIASGITMGGYAVGKHISPMKDVTFVAFLIIFGVVYVVSIIRFVTVTEGETKLINQLEAKTGRKIELGKKFVQIIRK